jgi:prepilin-type N-terminal cleavage/methylation domain-containing protein/prepilin-type processing-associated H-X9-DG protein
MKDSAMSRSIRGFTLVELLVVIAIIGVLVALLLPAVQAARESARRAQCSNNMKQLGLATHNYADANRSTFPAGEYSCCWGTWLVGLMPYIEQKNLYDQYKFFGAVQNQAGNAISQTDANTRYGGALNQPVTKTQISAYTCPSDSITATPGVISGITFHNYVANHGNTTLARTVIFGKTLAGKDNVFRNAPFAFIGAWNSNPQAIRFADISDGLSNTLMFSETVQGRDGDLRGFAWWNGGAHFETYLTPNSPQPDIVENIAYCKPINISNPPCDGPTSANPSNIAARSRHPGGVQAAMCDGSVRFVSQSVNLDIWRGAGSAAGKEPAGEF